MSAFNYRDFIRKIRQRTWQFYFDARALSLPDGVAWEQETNAVHAGVLEALETLDEVHRGAIMFELVRAKRLANWKGIQALRNAVPLAAPMLDDFELHSSDEERALWALVNWPTQVKIAESIMQFDARVEKRQWWRVQLSPGQTISCGPEDQKFLRDAIALAFTPKRARLRACEIDVLTRHLDGGVQLDIRVEDNLQRNFEFDENDHTVWREYRPPLRMTVVIYPEAGAIDMVVPGGEKTRTKVLGPLAKHVFKCALEPITMPQPLFLLNRLRDGVRPDEHSGLDLRDYGVDHVRLSECRVRTVVAPLCDFSIKPPGIKGDADVLDCVRAHDSQLMTSGFNIVSGVVSLYFGPTSASKERVLHIGLKPTGISNLRDMNEKDARLAENLVLALGVKQVEPPKKQVHGAVSDVEGA